MTDFSPLDSALYESTPEKIAASLRYLRKADAVMAALMPLSAAPQAPPAAVQAWILRTGHGTGIHIGERPPVDCVGWKPLTAGDIKDAPPAAVAAGHVSMPVERVQHVIDLLAERAHLNNARSPAHNARLLLEATLTAAKENGNG